MKLGSMWRKMMRPSEQPSSRAAVTNSSVRSDRKRPRTTRASCAQPMSERITVIMKYCVVRRPVVRHRRGQREPDRDVRDRQHELDHALDREVDAAAVIARDAADHDADQQRQDDADEADRERDLPALHDAAPARSARAGRRRPGTAAGCGSRGGEQVTFRREQAEHRIFVALAEEVDGDLAARCRACRSAASDTGSRASRAGWKYGRNVQPPMHRCRYRWIACGG